MATASEVIAELTAAAPPSGATPRSIAATPYQWRVPNAIPTRPWVLGHWLLRGTIACVVAPGGVGKSTLMAGVALTLATGKPFLGQEVKDRPQRVWLWNLEDDMDELSRSIQAAAIYHDIAAWDVGDRLFVDSGMEGATLCTAVDTGKGYTILEPVYEALAAELIARAIDVLIVDPFVSSHKVPENDNGMIDAVAKEWGRVAKRAGCVIVLVHHTSKAGANEVSALSARGAVSLVNAARSALVLNRMGDEDADRFGFSKAERRRYVAVSDDKHNRALASGASWFRLESVDLGNGGWGQGDSIAVAVPWTPPDPFAGLTPHDLAKVQTAIGAGEWRENVQASDWGGYAVAKALGWNADDPADRKRIKALISTWVANGVLRISRRPNPNGKDKSREVPWLVVGDREGLPPTSPPPSGERCGSGEE